MSRQLNTIYTQSPEGHVISDSAQNTETKNHLILNPNTLPQT